MKLPGDFKDLLVEFAREEVEVVVIGGYAFSYHAEPRATKDLDLLLGGTPDNLERAARALARYGAPSSVVDATRHLGDDEIAYMGEPPLRIDLLRTIEGVATGDVIKRADRASWDGIDVRVISLSDLIANKRAAGRLQDQADLEKLEKLAQHEPRP